MPAASSVDALILCGGLGTRLRSVVGDRVKPMAEVDGKPFLEILIDSLARRGFQRFILCVGYRADGVRAYFNDTADRKFVFSEEPSPLGTAGAFKLASLLCRPGPVLALNGDSICPLDPVSLLDAHVKSGALATIAVAPSGGRLDGGSVEFDGDRRVTAFHEKNADPAAFINAGVYVLEPAVFDRIPAGRAVSIERETFPGMVANRLFAYPTDRLVYDIGTPDRLEAFRAVFRAGF
jgi:NDP-sugar pyrophosphorylase family protein